MTRICMIPRVSGVGGMVSFQARFSAALERRGIGVCHDLDDRAYDAVLLIGGTRNLVGLVRARRRGVRIVQRLNGINWLHRRRPSSLRYFLRAEYGRWVLGFIRRWLATGIVYQSEFARRWWEDWFGLTRLPSCVVHNGVDLEVYTPSGPHERPSERIRLLVVEGTMGGGYELGLETSLQLAEGLAEKFPLELMVVGRITPDLQAAVQASSRVPVCWAGLVPGEQIPAIDRSAHLFYSSDIHPACPNAVIEALACGLPVVAFDTGALPELVRGEAGRVVPYGADPWKLEPPDVTALTAAAAGILAAPEHFRRGARAQAEQAFGLEEMTDRYLRALLE
ncbi:MAG: glycosyltransferase family 4 protein [Anaerolineales bacterium]|nr:glycosyltransferase family 4 protein [Anaerolineales bacterium]